mmetsp:Transcript_8744/g.11016  ORF Transcript_8744/g.11016 Transcript_8744/m.11016 type:complete len:163 (-) Transcript_8744:253-741(-)
MTLLHLFIVNKSGGLIYHRELSRYAPSIDVNVLLRIGSTFHSLCSIAVEASPVKGRDAKSVEDDGIEIIRGDSVILCCFQTRTGIKFVVTAEPGTQGLKKLLKTVYVLYADCTLKDPFYELDMPIRCELFSQAIDDLVEKSDSESKSNSNSRGRDESIVKLR